MAAMKMVDIVMQAAPYFVFALLAGVIAKMADSPKEVIEIFIGLGSYSLTLVTGLFFMVFVFYPLMLKPFVKNLVFVLPPVPAAQGLIFVHSSGMTMITANPRPTGTRNILHSLWDLGGFG